MIVYCLTSIVSGKRYVGQTTLTAARRFSDHCREAMRLTNPKTGAIHNAIRKYGAAAFTVETLETCADLESLNEAERHWIRALGTRFPNGYNLAAGGQSNPPARAVETKGKISAANKGRKLSHVTRARMTASRSADLSSAAKLTWDDVREIRRRYNAGETQTSLASSYDVKQASISKIVRNESWIDPSYVRAIPLFTKKEAWGKITSTQREEIVKERASGASAYDLALKYGISKVRIYQIAKVPAFDVSGDGV